MQTRRGRRGWPTMRERRRLLHGCGCRCCSRRKRTDDQIGEKEEDEQQQVCLYHRGLKNPASEFFFACLFAWCVCGCSEGRSRGNRMSSQFRCAKEGGFPSSSRYHDISQVADGEISVDRRSPLRKGDKKGRVLGATRFRNERSCNERNFSHSE